MPAQCEEVAIGAGLRKTLKTRTNFRVQNGAACHRSVAALPGTTGTRRPRHDHGVAQAIAGKGSHGAPRINDASGVRPKAAPGGRDSRIGSIEVREIGAGDLRRSEPPRRLSGGRCGRSRRQSCAARCRRRRRCCPHRCGQSCTAQCGGRCPAKPATATHGVLPRRAEAMPAAGAAGQGERGEAGDERGAQRRREDDEAGVRRRVREGCTACRALCQAERGVSVSERRRQGSQRKSERSGDCSVEPGREAGRP